METKLNCTTKVPAEVTAGEIQRLLAKSGAIGVSCEFDGEGNVVSLSFKVEFEKNKRVTFRLPVNSYGVHLALEEADYVPAHLKNADHARNIAWRALKEWVECQLNMVNVGIVDLIEAFLPYAQNIEGDTIYSIIKSRNFDSLIEQI